MSERKGRALLVSTEWSRDGGVDYATVGIAENHPRRCAELGIGLLTYLLQQSLNGGSRMVLHQC